MPSRDQFFEALVGGGDEAHVGLEGLVAADALEEAGIEGAQDFDLGVGVDLADLIEEKRAAVGLLETARAPLGRPGECSFFVAEEFALEQLRGERGAMDGDEFCLVAVAEVMDGVGDQLLAGAALALDEDGGAGGGDLFDGVEDLLHHGGIADEVLEAEVFLDLLLEFAVFLLGLAALAGRAG